MSGRVAFVACIALTVFAGFCAGEIAEKDEQGVHVLDHHNFDETVKSKKVVVVYFYAKWSKKCTKFNANWTKTIENFAGVDDIAFASLNVDESLSKAQQYFVNKYPFIVVFRDGKDYPYDRKDMSAKGLTAMIKPYTSDKWIKPNLVSDHLTMDNFETTVKEGDGMLVKFYVRWCGHCRAMSDEWEKAAKACRKLNPPMKMFQIDCEAEKDLCTENKVDSYPTLRFYRAGKIIEQYQGGRNKDDFMNYLRQKTGAASKKLDATQKRLNEHINALHKRGQPAIIGFFPEEEGDHFDVYELVAGELRDRMEIVHVVSDTLGRKYGMKGKYGIYLSHPEHLRSQYEDQFHILADFDADDKDGLKDWIYTKSRPLVGHLQKHNVGIDNIYWEMSVVTMYYTVDFGPEMVKSTQFWRKKLVEIAKDYKEHKNLSFAVADDEQYAGLLHSIELSEHAFDVMMAISGPHDKQFFPITEDWDDDAYRTHIDKYLVGKLPGYLKSEPEPAYNDGPVKIAVAKNWNQLYFDPDRHVVIMFYQPWCPHCRTFEPIFLKGARHFKDRKDIVFIKYNLQENDLPPSFKEPIEGYPATFFRYHTQDKIQQYHGGPNLDTFIKYVEANAELENDTRSGQAPQPDEESSAAPEKAEL